MSLLPNWLQGRPKCPASPEEKEVVEHGFEVLDQYLGEARLREAAVVEPTPQFFPDRWDQSRQAVERLFARVCQYMQIDQESIELSFWQDDEVPQASMMEMLNGPVNTSGAGGTYQKVGSAEHVRLNVTEIKDPEALVATMVHELAHVLLLSRLGMPHDQPHMEAITDLATIYLGFGIFCSNSLLRYRAWAEGGKQGWSVKRKGYLSPEMGGWALALFAQRRGESKPTWARHLATDGKTYLRMGLRYLEAQ